MTLYQNLGWTVPLERYLDAWKRGLSAPQRDDLIPSTKRSLASDSSNVATCSYLLGDHAMAAKFARECVRAVVDYLFGDWRDQILTSTGKHDRTWWRAHSSWLSRFQEGLCWSCALEDWKSVRQISSYPSQECMVDAGLSKEDKFVYLALAQYLRGEPLKTARESFVLIEKGKKQKPKALAKVIEALYASDSTMFQKSLETYLQYFRKNEFKRTFLDKLLCLDGTSLFYIGSQSGLVFSIPPEAKDYVIRLK